MTVGLCPIPISPKSRINSFASIFFFLISSWKRAKDKVEPRAYCPGITTITGRKPPTACCGPPEPLPK